MRRNVSHHGSSVVNYMLQLSVEMVFIAVQIIASGVVLTLSSQEKSQAHLKELIISYTILCILAFVLLWLEYCNLEQTSEPDSNTSTDFYFQRIILFETSLSFLIENDPQRRVYRTTSDLHSETASAMELVMNWLRLYINIFFCYWLIISGLEIRYLASSPSFKDLKLYRLTVVFFSYGCFEHILAVIECLVKCVTGALVKHEARFKAINALPIHRFKQRDNSGNGWESFSSAEGVVAAGTDMERVISREDAVCSICLGTYADNDELKELPCSHLHHKDCVDKWLKIKAACPLCNRVILRSNPT